MNTHPLIPRPSLPPEYRVLEGRLKQIDFAEVSDEVLRSTEPDKAMHHESIRASREWAHRNPHVFV